MRLGSAILASAVFCSLALGLTGCSAPTAEVGNGDCTGSCQALGDQPVVAPVGRLWVEKGTETDSFFRVDRAFIEPITTQGVGLRAMSVNVYTADNDVSGAFVDASKGAQEIAVLRDGRYPASAKIDIYLAHDDTQLAGLSDSHLRTTIDIKSPDALPEATAAVMTLPFSLWRLRVTAKVDRGSFFPDAYSVQIGNGWQVGESGNTLSMNGARIDLKSGETQVYTFVAPPSGALTGTGSILSGGSGSNVAMTVDKPGDYVLDASGLRHAKPGEIEDPTPAAPDLAQPPGDTPDLAQPAAPAWPTDCGNDNQSACQGASSGCAPNTTVSYADFSDSLCHACGTDGNAACRDSANNRVCDAGNVSSYADFSDNLCHACGTDGKAACRDSANNRVCDAGNVSSYADFSDYLCHTCGTDGKGACRDATNNRVCNPGYEWSYARYSDYLCHKTP